MLGEHPIHPVLLATDLGAARHFYHTQLGLEILNESDAATRRRILVDNPQSLYDFADRP